MAHMFEKHYTLEQANAMIPHVRRLFAEVRTLLQSPSADARKKQEQNQVPQSNGSANGHGVANGSATSNGHGPRNGHPSLHPPMEPATGEELLSGLQPQEEAATADYSGWTEEKRHEAAYRLLNALQSQGIVIQDVERGLIDFPSIHKGREIFLCYELTDGHSIQYFHETNAGYAGRKKITEIDE